MRIGLIGVKYKRVLLKISGEALLGSDGSIHDDVILQSLSLDIKSVCDLGIEVCLVIGGGNIFRGSSSSEEFSRASNDYIGMLATVINALYLQNYLEKMGLSSRVLSAIPMPAVCESYVRRRAVRHLEKGRVVICAAGIGNPFFTTDTSAVLRGVEMGCDVIFKGTQVNGVYSSDPRYNSDAIRYDSITYDDLLSSNLKIMDASAISLARDSSMPIIVFDLKERGSFFQVVQNRGMNTIISDGM